MILPIFFKSNMILTIFYHDFLTALSICMVNGAVTSNARKLWLNVAAKFTHGCHRGSSPTTLITCSDIVPAQPILITMLIIKTNKTSATA